VDTVDTAVMEKEDTEAAMEVTEAAMEEKEVSLVMVEATERDSVDTEVMVDTD